jgi:hypothetical protein
MMYQPVENMAYLERATRDRTGEERSLWERILELIEQDLAERRIERLLVQVQEEGESGSSYEKEIGELSASERHSLPPLLKEQVAERLLERYLAEQGYVDLLEKRRAYTKKIEELSPEDLPALIQADRQRAEEEHRNGRERADFAREARAGLERTHVLQPAEVKETRKEVNELSERK